MASNFCLERGFSHVWKDVVGAGSFQTLRYRIYHFYKSKNELELSAYNIYDHDHVMLS